MEKLKEMWKKSEYGHEEFDMSKIGKILKYKEPDQKIEEIMQPPED